MKKEEIKITSNRFEILGFFKNYWVGNKLMGSIKLEKPDRKQLGLAGKKTEELTADLYLPDSKRTIKKGTKVWTELNALYGKSKVNFFGIKGEKK
jgi:hypothetical protein